MVIDDDILMLKIINFMFSTNGFKVLEASNGQGALEILDKHERNIDLIITDYNIPGINGLELANLVRTHQKYQDTPLILMTSNTKITSELGKHYNVFNEIIDKPFSSELILNKVTALLDK